MLYLEICNLARHYNGREVFAGIDQALGQGECLAVTGPNGSGKTTLLKVLAGLLRPSAGEVKLFLGEEKLPRERNRDIIGFVLPDLNLYGELSALENLSFFARLRGLGMQTGDCGELLDRVQLGKEKDNLVGTFSTGMKQRLKLAFALLHRPRLLLLDEPGANLDKAGHALVGEIIREQKETGMVIVSTNDPAEVSRYGDQVLELDFAGRGPVG